MSDKKHGDKHKHHKDEDLEKWAETDRKYQHPSDFKGPLEEVDTSAEAEAAKREKEKYARHRADEKRHAEDKDRQHPGEWKGPLEEVDIDDDK